MPVRRRLVGDAAGTDRLGPAMALDNATNNATRLVGRLMGGIIYQGFGAVGVLEHRFDHPPTGHVVAIELHSLPAELPGVLGPALANNVVPAQHGEVGQIYGRARGVALNHPAREVSEAPQSSEFEGWGGLSQLTV